MEIIIILFGIIIVVSKIVNINFLFLKFNFVSVNVMIIENIVLLIVENIVIISVLVKYLGKLMLVVFDV